MSETSDLRQVQKRIYQMTTFEDGLWDLLLGAIFMALAVYPLTRELLGPVLNAVLFLVALGILVGVQVTLRNRISTPRIGYAQPRRSPKLRLLFVFTLAMVALTFGLLLATLLGQGSEAPPVADAASAERGYTVDVIVLLVIGMVFSAMGRIFGAPRLYFYGWSIGLANLASVYMTHSAGWRFNLPLAVVAGVILLIGFALLGRFLRKYPAQPQEA